jgi:ribonuclease J
VTLGIDTNYKISFLGGLGEIGKNCAVVKYLNKLLIIDCGIMFPTEEMPGVDLVIPDFSSILESDCEISGVVITHGHEDHIGALGYLLAQTPLKISGSSLALKIAAFRVNELGLKSRATFYEVTDLERLDIGPFDVEFIPVTHSVPHSFAVALHTEMGAIIHTGDFKLDQYPMDGRRTNLSRFGEISETESVRLLLADSTNADKSGVTDSESSVGSELDKIFAAQGNSRIITACFASHLHRIEQIIQVANLHGRKVKILGKSMSRNIKVACDLKVIDIPKNALVDTDDIDKIDDSKLCIICTGSQGEPLAALSQLAYGQYRSVSIKKGDTVILSSHPIPGNERSVSNVINALGLKGAEVFHSMMSNVSGHARSYELSTMISTVKPKAYIPVHGEYRHLKANESIAKKMAVEQVVLCLDGDVVEITANEVKIVDKVESSYVFVDGILDDVDVELLHERKTLALDGIVIVIVVLDPVSNRLMHPTKVITRGWVDSVEGDDLIDKAGKLVDDFLLDLPKGPNIRKNQVADEIRALVSRFVRSNTRRKPTVVPVIIGI